MLANCQDCCTGNIHWKNPASIRRRMKFWEKSTKCSVLACWSRFLIDWFLFGTTKNIHVSVLVEDANAIKLRGYVTLLDPDFRLQSREAFLQKSLLVLISARLRPNWNQPRNVRMFAGLHRNWRTTEGNERLSVETRVPHAAVPSLPGDFEASLDAESAVGVRICIEASALPDPPTEEGKTFCCCCFGLSLGIRLVLCTVGSL